MRQFAIRFRPGALKKGGVSPAVSDGSAFRSSICCRGRVSRLNFHLELMSFVAPWRPFLLLIIDGGGGPYFRYGYPIEMLRFWRV